MSQSSDIFLQQGYVLIFISVAVIKRKDAFYMVHYGCN